MEIIVGKTAGFCYGVERAVDGAIAAIKKSNSIVYCLGEIVHNRQVVKKLEDLGVKFIDTIENASTNSTVLIRAHGVPNEIYDFAKNMDINVQDFTCPNVLKVHKIAEKYREEGYFIFLLGAKEHPENIGTLSHCGKDCFVFENEAELFNGLEVFKKSGKNKLLLISQTTYSLDKFDKIEKKLYEVLDNSIDFVVRNTICKTTELRQKETEEIAKKVDSMIIVGGKNSSNTKKLYEIAKKYCPNTVLIENVQELDFEKVFDKIGIMAGASTPKEDIIESLRKY